MKSALAIFGATVSLATIGTIVSIIAGTLTCIFVGWQLWDKYQERKQRKTGFPRR